MACPVPDTVTIHQGYPKVNDNDRELTVTVLYDIRLLDEAAALARLPSIGAAYGDNFGYPRAPEVVRREVEQLSNAEDNPLCRGMVVYRYAKREADAGRDNWELDLTPETIHVSHVKRLADQRVWTPEVTGGRGEPDTSTAIGRSDDGKEVAGVDIFAPFGVLTVTRYFDPERVTGTYLRTLEEAVRHTNASPYTTGRLRLDTGELLFTGPVVEDTAAEKTRVQFKFLVRRTERNVTVDLDLNDVTLPEKVPVTIPVKRGWDYIWYMPGQFLIDPGRNDDPPDPGKRYVMSGIASVHVARLYDSTDFGKLDARLPENAPFRIFGPHLGRFGP